MEQAEDDFDSLQQHNTSRSSKSFIKSETDDNGSPLKSQRPYYPAIVEDDSDSEYSRWRWL